MMDGLETWHSRHLAHFSFGRLPLFGIALTRNVWIRCCTVASVMETMAIKVMF
jgi:hypothetical protein